MTLKNDKVSVFIPCYTRARSLDAALKSVLAQTYTNWECILVNDGSTDDTEAVAAAYTNDTRFKYIQTANKGLSAARNTGIKNSAGDLIQLLDADDLIETNKLAEAVNFYRSADAGLHIIVYASMRYFDADDSRKLQILGRNNFIPHIELKQDDELQMQQQVIAVRNPFVVSAPLYPVNIFNKIGIFDEELSALEDWDLHLRCSFAGYKFHHHYAKHARTLIRLHHGSMMGNQQLLDENFFRVSIKHQLDSNNTNNLSPQKGSVFSRIKKRFS